MQHYKTVKGMAAIILGATLFVSACQKDPLNVSNLQVPDVSRAYASPANVETLESGIFKNMFNGQFANLEAISPQSFSMSLESHSTLGNAGMGTRASIPRSPIDNTIGNSVATGNFRDFDAISRNTKTAANVVAAVVAYNAAGINSGSLERDARNKAFALFAMGYGLGHLSLVYDSAAIILPEQASDFIPPFSASAAVNTAALKLLDDAIVQANRATNQSIPAEWISDPATAVVTMPRFVQIMRSLKARLRAGVARTPAERASVDWASVIADATNGIQSDFIVQANATTGWSIGMYSTLRQASSWSQMTPMILGMGDTSRVGDQYGSYRDWIKQSLTTRTAFLMRTPDNRWPKGETRAAQIVASGGTSKAGPPTGNPRMIFRNRPEGEDNPGEAWGTWYYDNHRNWGVISNGGNGPYTVMARAENDMLAAEGYLRTNRFAEATALIDRYRVAAGLPPVTGIADLTTGVPGGSSCVPNVPQAPAFNTTACGNLMEALKWEKRSETAFTGYSQWFMDSRGWGDLPLGTALEWPVPYDELFARAILKTYTTSRVSARSNYGF